MLNDSTTRRLAFIKYLYTVGVDQSVQPEPLNSSSILTIHDSVELFLQLASEHLNVGNAQPGFMEYWELINPKLAPNQLAQKESMRRLNKSRVSLKHHGTLPSKLDIDSFRGSATAFFQENSPIVFGIEFGSVSLASLVVCTEARTNLQEATELMKGGKFNDAIDKITTAFLKLINDYEARKEAWFGRSPFSFGTSFNSADIDSETTVNDRRLKKFLEKLRDTVDKLQSATRILSLGLDYARYSRFRLLTPSISQSLNGTIRIARFKDHASTSEECQFCFDYVIESALRLQQSDFNVDYDFSKLGGLARISPPGSRL